MSATVALISTLFPVLGILFSLCYWKVTSKIELHPDKQKTREVNGLLGSSSVEYKDSATKIWQIYCLIYDGAHSFLYAEYRYVSVFVAGFSLIILLVLGFSDSFPHAALTMVAFIVGCITSILSGFIGMKIGVFANARTAVAAQQSLTLAFQTSFKAAVVMGFVLCSLGILNLYILIQLYWLYFTDAMGTSQEETHAMFEAVAGYGLGGSCIGMFGRVGGGIYTKAADVGADLVGKVEAGIPEDDPRNPATIADNVGDNVGDIAGMGADLFGSFAEATCAALVIGSQGDLWSEWNHIAFPIAISAFGIGVCFLTSFVATHISTVQNIADIEPVLKKQLLVSTVLMTPTLLGVAYLLLPAGEFCVENCDTTDPSLKKHYTKNWKVFLSGACGLWSGLIIGYTTEYYTSHSYAPVREVADACETGAATNIIYGLALGYKSVIIPAFCLATTVYVAHTMASFYGVAIAALGILSTLSIGLTIDAFGPICDNAGGIAEMAELGEIIRQRTDALDAAGNTTAAIGKGFAIGSAALVSLALFSGFITVKADTFNGDVNLLKGFPFAGLLVGAMLPYWFTAMTMKSVGLAAKAMVEEVRRQFREYPGIMEGTQKPDYDKCIIISTNSSLQYMIAPAALVMFTPLIVGFGFGVDALAGVLCGALVSGVQMAISQSNTGGAWDNAKKYVESGALGEDKAKGSDIHAAAVTGDTVGDPLKDTSGPSINILIKLMAIISLVFANSFPSNTGGYIGALVDKL